MFQVFSDISELKFDSIERITTSSSILSKRISKVLSERLKSSSPSLSERLKLSGFLERIRLGEQTSLTAGVSKLRPWFARVTTYPGSWLVAILVVATTFLALSGVLFHKSHAAHSPTLPKAIVRHSRVQTPPNIVEDFPQCNPAVAWRSSQQIPFDGHWCDSQQAGAIRGLLDKFKYDYQAVVPQPYVYPARVLDDLLVMDQGKLNTTLRNYEQMANKMGKLGTLVKLFAWGLPVHARELLQIVGGDSVVEAFMRCNVVAKCGDSPLYTSAVQLFPVDRTSIIVATDWHVASRQIKSQVGVVDLHTLFLAHNIPQATGSRVLDLGSGSGVLGLVAATSRGAEEVALLEPSLRAARFATFNVLLNGLGEKVKVIQRPLADAQYIFDDKFFLILAHPTGTKHQKEAIVQNVLQASKVMLTHSGSFVLALEGHRCDDFVQDFNQGLCGNTHSGDLAGSVLCRNVDKSKPSQEAIVYGWRNDKERASKRKCGHFNTVQLDSFDNAHGPQACGFARMGMLCPASPTPRPSLLRRLFG